jgi:hypothetical protein
MRCYDRSSQRTSATAALLFCAALALYGATLAPSVAAVFDDSLEFQLVTYQLAIAHPTGYPLFTLLGWLFTRLPLGEVAYRVNLMTALFGAATVALTYLLGRALVRQSDADAASPHWPGEAGAILGAMALAVSPVVWSQATLAEVYTLNAAIVAAILVVLVPMDCMTGRVAPVTSDALADRARQTDLRRHLILLAGLLGLGLAHHRTVVLLLPAAALVLWRLRGRWVFPPLSVVALFAPLLLYLYLPLRGHVGSLDGSYENTAAGFVRHVTASGYGTFLVGNPLAVSRTPGFYLNLFVEQFGWVGVLVGLVGLLVLGRRGHRVTLIAFVTYGVFNLFYQVADIEVFFIPLFIISAVWFGHGAAWLLEQASGAWPSRSPQRWTAAAVVLMILFAQPACMFAVNLPTRDRSHDWHTHDYGMDMLGQPLPGGAAVVGILGEVTLLRYFQATHHLRTDLLPVAADLPDQRLATVGRLLDEGYAVYLTRELAGAPERWSLSALGPLIRVHARPPTDPPGDVTVVDIPITPHVGLYGYTITRPGGHTTPPPLRLSLVWRAIGSGGSDLKVSARLLRPDGAVVAQADAVPVHFAYPTTAWRAGEFIMDVYDLALPTGLPADNYTPVIILYDPGRDAAEVGRATLPALPLP